MNALKKGKNQELWLRYYIQYKVGVCIIDSIPHCHTRMLRKEANNQECVFVTMKRTKIEYVSSIVFHTAIPSYGRLYLCDHFFSNNTWRTLDSHASPVGDICEGNEYSAYLFSQVYSEFGFQNISFLYVYLYFRLYI